MRKLAGESPIGYWGIGPGESVFQATPSEIVHCTLTVYEQCKHAAERERVLDALGQRAKASQGANQHVVPATVAGTKTTEQIAREAGMSERSWRNRTKIGRALGEQTTAVLDHADVTDDKQRNLLNSTTQLNHLANIARKHGDEVAAEVAERVLSTAPLVVRRPTNACADSKHLSILEVIAILRRRG
jgi:hypothetical protein